MNIFLTSPSERLKEWRKFKLFLNNEMTDMEHLIEVNNWWAQCPLSARSLDPYTAETWPSGWELIYRGDFCRSAISLGMEQTLLLRNGRWNSDRVKLHLIDDNKEDIFLVVNIDDKWILNYEYNNVIEVSKTKFKILNTFKFDGNTHCQF